MLSLSRLTARQSAPRGYSMRASSSALFIASWPVALLLVLFLLLWFVPVKAYAQSVGDIEAAQKQSEQIFRQEEDLRLRDQQELQQKRTPKGLDTGPLKPELKESISTAFCHQIETIKIHGAPNLSSEARISIKKKYQGRCLNVSDIENILAQITIDYIDRGFITTRAYLPSQNLSSGVLEILVLEGVINSYLIEDGGADSVATGNVFPKPVGGVLNLRDLEQGIEQINRLGSNRAVLDIQPGNKPGESQVVVRNQPTRPYQFLFSVDNHGSDSTGDRQAAFSAIRDNVFGFNDQLLATYRHSTPSDSNRQMSRSSSLNYSVPFGYSTLSFGASYSNYVSEITTTSGISLQTSGNSKSHFVSVDHVAFRNQNSRINVSGSLTAKESQNFLDDLFLDISSRKLTILEVGVDASTGWLGGVFAVDLSYAQGLSWFNALKDANDIGVDTPQAQFGKYAAQVSYSRPFTLWNKQANFSSRINAQKAQSPLYGSEQISIGGIYSVRGFIDNSISGDDGFYWRNEVSLYHPVTVAGDALSLRWFAAYDTGSVRSRAAGVEGGQLSGATFGVSTSWNGFFVEAFQSRPVSLPDDRERESSHLWLRLNYTF